MRWLYLIIFILLLQSCSISKKLDKYCPLCPTKTIIKDSISVVYKDSLVIFDLPSDTVFNIQKIPCENINIPLKRIVKGIITAESYVINSNLYINAYLNQKIIKDSIKIKYVTETKIKQIDRNIEVVKYKTPLSNYAIFGLLGMLIILLIYLVFKK